MNRLERIQQLGVSSGVEAFDIIVRRIPGIRRTLELTPQVETLRQLHIELNYMFKGSSPLLTMNFIFKHTMVFLF